MQKLSSFRGKTKNRPKKSLTWFFHAALQLSFFRITDRQHSRSILTNSKSDDWVVSALYRVYLRALIIVNQSTKQRNKIYVHLCSRIVEIVSGVTAKVNSDRKLQKLTYCCPFSKIKIVWGTRTFAGRHASQLYFKIQDVLCYSCSNFLSFLGKFLNSIVDLFKELLEMLIVDYHMFGWVVIHSVEDQPHATTLYKSVHFIFR